MSNIHAEMPTEPLHPQLESAVATLTDEAFYSLSYGSRLSMHRAILCEPVFFDENDELVSQKIIYSPKQVDDPKLAQKAIDDIQSILDFFKYSKNPVQVSLSLQAGGEPVRPNFLKGLLPIIDKQPGNLTRAIGGLMIVEDNKSLQTSLMFQSNPALKDTKQAWLIRDMAITGRVHDPDNQIKTRSEENLAEMATSMAMHCLTSSRKLKPAIVSA